MFARVLTCFGRFTRSAICSAAAPPRLVITLAPSRLSVICVRSAVNFLHHHHRYRSSGSHHGARPVTSIGLFRRDITLTPASTEFHDFGNLNSSLMPATKHKRLAGPTGRGNKSHGLLGSINMRYVSLVCLTFQTTSIIILYSYSRKVPEGSAKYLSSTVVVIAEVLKLLFCSAVILKDSGYNIERFVRTLNKEIFYNLKESLKVLVPASLYALQNNLAFYALTNLDPATYQVAYQLKILTTAIFSVLVVNKKIRQRQWFALFLLFVGVSLVQLPTQDDDNSAALHSGDSGKNRFMGLLSVVACCMSSGFSGVYFERLIKFNPNQSLWIRNFQLALFCLLISIFAMVYQDFSSILTAGMLQGYSTLTWTVVFLQAFGGLIVAAVVKHADNVLKGFATSISIILSTLLSFLLFENFNPSTNFYYGATLVIVSTIMYSL